MTTKKTTTPTERLLALMERYGLSAQDVGDILGRSAQAIRVYRSGARVIPQDQLGALEAALAPRRLVAEMSGRELDALVAKALRRPHRDEDAIRAFVAGVFGGWV